MINLAGKTAVVFGLANKRSIAWGIAQKLHEAGATLAICYQNERMKLEAEGLIAELPGASGFQCDVSNDAEIDTLFAALKDKYGKIETLVHAVAFAPANELRGDFLNTTREGFRVAMDWVRTGPEHGQHPVGDRIATCDITCAEQNGHEAEGLLLKRARVEQREHAADNNNAVHEIGSGHQRRVQDGRHAADNHPASEGRQHEDVDGDEAGDVDGETHCLFLGSGGLHGVLGGLLVGGVTGKGGLL